MDKTKNKKTNYKVIFTLRLKQALKELGFEPVLENDNIKKPGYKCWVYEATPAFLEAFIEVVGRGEK